MRSAGRPGGLGGPAERERRVLDLSHLVSFRVGRGSDHPVLRNSSTRRSNREPRPREVGDPGPLSRYRLAKRSSSSTTSSIGWVASISIAPGRRSPSCCPSPAPSRDRTHAPSRPRGTPARGTGARRSSASTRRVGRSASVRRGDRPPRAAGRPGAAVATPPPIRRFRLRRRLRRASRAHDHLSVCGHRVECIPY